jgi:hypothetical protein
VPADLKRLGDLQILFPFGRQQDYRCPLDQPMSDTASSRVRQQFRSLLFIQDYLGSDSQRVASYYDKPAAHK